MHSFTLGFYGIQTYTRTVHTHTHIYTRTHTHSAAEYNALLSFHSARDFQGGRERERKREGSGGHSGETNAANAQ